MVKIMNGFSFLMLIFSILIFLVGLYTYTGHKSYFFLWRVNNIKTITRKQLKDIGKLTMISSIIPLIISIFGMILDI